MERIHPSTTEYDPKRTRQMQRKQLILNFIHRFRDRYGISPTYKQIALHIGYKSRGETSNLTHQLIAEGWLKQEKDANGNTVLIPEYEPTEPYFMVSDHDLIVIARRITKI